MARSQTASDCDAWRGELCVCRCSELTAVLRVAAAFAATRRGGAAAARDDVKASNRRAALVGDVSEGGVRCDAPLSQQARYAVAAALGAVLCAAGDRDKAVVLEFARDDAESHADNADEGLLASQLERAVEALSATHRPRRCDVDAVTALAGSAASLKDPDVVSLIKVRRYSHSTKVFWRNTTRCFGKDHTRVFSLSLSLSLSRAAESRRRDSRPRSLASRQTRRPYRQRGSCGCVSTLLAPTHKSSLGVHNAIR